MQHSYITLAERLLADIKAQRYDLGERLPSVRAYAAGQGVSVATAMRCYRHLETLGYVQARPKSGMFVADWKAQQSTRRAAQQALSRIDPPPMAYDKLVSLEHRLSELYALTAQPLRLGLHLANAAPQWYPGEALAKIGQRLLRHQGFAIGAYPTGSGWPALKAELMTWLATSGLDLQANELLITNGSTEALNVALRAVARPGDAVIVESPVYFGLLQMIDNLGLKAVEVPCIAGVGISLEALDYALEHQPGVRAVVAMPGFQNPLGCAMPEKNKRRLLKLVEHYDIALIEDDAFGDLRVDEARPQPVKAWDRHGRVIYCGSCSKSVAPAFRLGWVAGGRYHARIESLKLGNSLVTPLFEQAVLAEFMRAGGLPSHLRKLRERSSANVALALAAVQQHFPAQTEVVSSAGGWWLWIALPAPVDSLVLLRRAVARGISFTPGALFSGSGKFSNHIRLNICRPWDREMAQGMEILGELVSQAAATGPAQDACAA